MALKRFIPPVLCVAFSVFLFLFVQFTPFIHTQLPTHITIGSTVIPVEVAHNDVQRERGLSGRSSLSGGMLFVFEKEGTSGFWMKDMNFSLDIIFADASGTIVTIYNDVSPQTYPKVFYPESPARYVLEVPAGFAKEHSIVLGMHIML